VKYCTRCKQEKPLDAFYKNKRYKDGHLSFCKDCRRSYVNNWQLTHPENRKANWLRHNFNISLEEYRAMERAQNYRCAICNELPKRPPLQVDHIHKTGKVRGLLCGPCNRAVGLFRENVGIMQRAEIYILKGSLPYEYQATNDK
jgi:hypothetical protein